MPEQHRGVRTTLAWVLIGVPVVAVMVAGCDKGRAPYDEAVALEEKGSLAEAAEKYDGVCRRAPDSKLCLPSQQRAAKVRLTLGEKAIELLKFSEARTALAFVLESSDEDAKKRAKVLMESPAMVNGLRWEAASKATDKALVLGEMEALAKSNSPVAAKAAQWIAAERPAIWLTAAKGACARSAERNCAVYCRAIIEKHADTEQATEAKKLLAAYELAEQRRLQPLLVQVEKKLQECVKLHREQKAFHNCTLQQLAIDDEPLRALAACGGDQSESGRRSEKLKDAWRKLLEDIGDDTRKEALEKRWSDACDHGEYQKADVPTAPAADKGDPAACYPCASQEDFDIAWQKKTKCCPVVACGGDSACSGGRVCCRIPMGTLCTDAKRCGAADRVR